MNAVAPLALGLLLSTQAAAPSLIDELPADEAAAARVVGADRAATRRSLDDLLARVDASVHSDRQRPEQRRVQFDRQGLALGIRVGSLYAGVTGDRSYLRRFRAREQRLAGTTLLNDRRFKDALAPLTAALGEAQALGDRWLETITRVNLAYGHLELGDDRTALAECERAFEISRGLDDKARALTLLDLASVHMHLGNFPRAVTYSEQAVELSHKIGIRIWEGNSLLNLGVAHEQLGDLAASRRALERALETLENTRDQPSFGRTLYNLGVVAAREQRHADAAAYMERALPIIRAVDIRHSHTIGADPTTYQNPIELSALRVLVEAYLETGDTERAAVHLATLRLIEARPQPPGDHGTLSEATVVAIQPHEASI